MSKMITPIQHVTAKTEECVERRENTEEKMNDCLWEPEKASWRREHFNRVFKEEQKFGQRRR